MYGMVLMVAVTGSGDSTSFGKRDKGCHGEVVVVVSAPACCPAPAPACCPAPAPVCCPEPAKKRGLFARCRKSEPAPVCCPTPAPCPTCYTPVAAPCSTCATPGIPGAVIGGCALPPSGPPITITPVVPMPMDPKITPKKD